MDPAAPLVLRRDALIVPATELDAATRAQVDCGDDDFVVSMPRSRQTSKIVDRNTADLLQRFRSPASFNQVVEAFSRDHDAAIEEVRTAARPLIARFLRKGFLRSEGDGEAATEAGFGYQQQAGDLTFVRPLQVSDDIEVYLCRRYGSWVVVKIEGRDPAGAPALANEATVLRKLRGAASPELLYEGELSGRRYLVLERLPGVNAARAAAEWRIRGERVELLALFERITAAYAELHGHGVVQADVHPRNALVGRAGDVRLIDFGLARDLEAGGPAPRRAGVAYFYEPELAQALLDNQRSPPPTAAGEQFALAAMLYNLATGGYYCGFSVERIPMLRQIVGARARPFEDHGAEPWRDLEAILQRGLEKAPGRRFASVADFHAALAAAGRPRNSGAPQASRGGRPDPDAASPGHGATSVKRARGAEVSDDFLARTALDGPLLAGPLEAPRASVYCGSAGIAYALYRIALVRADAMTLATADVWGCRAAREIREQGAIYTDEEEFTPRSLGRASPYHTGSGVSAVQALIARARGDSAGQYAAAKRFVEASSQAAHGNDVAVGRSGTLVVATLLVEAGSAACHGKDPGLHDLGERTIAALWDDLREWPRMVAARGRSGGVAHGWAGYLYATLAWCRAIGQPLPEGSEARLHELSTLAVPHGRGVRWPWDLVTEPGKKPRHMPGWCNGSAGHVLLWNLAARHFDEPRFGELGEASAWDCWDAPRQASTLCCGLVGRAYALLSMYRASSGDVWRRRAGRLADSARSKDDFWDNMPHSLFYGRTGLAILHHDLIAPDVAAFPFFETGLGVPRSQPKPAPKG